MSNQIIINGNELSTNIFEKDGLVPRQIEENVVLTQPNFAMGQSKIPLVMSAYGEMSSKKIGSMIYEIPRKGNAFISQTVQSSTGSGTNILQVTFSDTNFKGIPVGKLVQDPATGTNATVVAVGAGTMTLAYGDNANSSSTTFASTDFAAGNLVSPRGAVTNLNIRQEVDSSYIVPAIDRYPIGIFGGDTTIYLQDTKRQTYIAAANGKKYYALIKQMEGLDRMYTEYYAYMYGDNKAIFDTATPRPQSLINQIKTFAPQNIRQKSQANISLSEFESTILEFKRNGSLRGDKLLCFCGLDYANNLYNILRFYGTTAGTNNVIGKTAIQGLDVTEYKAFGLTINIVVDMFLENNKVFGRTRSNSAIWVDASPVLLEDGSTHAPIYSVYNTVDGLHGWNVNGGFDIYGNPVQTGSTSQTSASTHYYMEKNMIIGNPNAALYHAF
jgi:hypothetical protein